MDAGTETVETAGVEWFDADVRVREWSYTSKPARGRCRIDHEEIRLKLRIELTDTDRVPDVLGVERWLAALCEKESTVEEYATAALAEFGGTVTVVGRTRTHGRIKVVLAAADHAN